MTEVPEHLLKRSRDRRAALGLGGGGGDSGGEETAPAAPSGEAGTDVEPAGATAAARPAAATPAEPEAVKPPEPLPPYIEAAVTRKKIPFWAMPVLAVLPIWAILYAGSLSPAKVGEVSQLDLGAQIFASKCASCHGADGSGGVGRPLYQGQVLKTFPNIEAQMEFVLLGTDGIGPGNPYGDPNREGGQHIAGTYNGGVMPTFLGSLTDAELIAVVRHEREDLSGEQVPATQIDANGELIDPNGNPYLVSGALVTPNGDPLFDSKGHLTIQIAGSAEGGVGGQPQSVAAQPGG